MRVITLDDNQVENLMKCLDLTLKTQGLMSMAMVVDLYNAIQTGTNPFKEKAHEEEIGPTGDPETD